MDSAVFPDSWTTTTMAVYYQLLCDLQKSDYESLWQRAHTRHQFMLETADFAKMLGLTLSTYRVARRTMLNNPTTHVPNRCSVQMLLLYWWHSGVIKNCRMNYNGSLSFKLAAESMATQTLIEIGCHQDKNIFTYDPYRRS